MKCQTVRLEGGATAIVCTDGRRKLARCRCKRQASLLCDWKMGEGKTCDVPICERCALEVAAGKHLCKDHQIAYADWKKKRGG